MYIARLPRECSAGDPMNTVDENRAPDLLRTYKHDRQPINAALAPSLLPFAPPLPLEAFHPTAARVTYPDLRFGVCRSRMEKESEGSGEKASREYYDG